MSIGSRKIFLERGGEAIGYMGFRYGMDLTPSISWSAKDRSSLDFRSMLVSSSPTVLVRGKRRPCMGFNPALGFAPLLSWWVAEDRASLDFNVGLVTPRPSLVVGRLAMSTCNLQPRWVPPSESSVGGEVRIDMGFSLKLDLAPSISWSAKNRSSLDFRSVLVSSSPTVLMRGKLSPPFEVYSLYGLCPSVILEDHRKHDWTGFHVVSSYSVILSRVGEGTRLSDGTADAALQRHTGVDIPHSVIRRPPHYIHFFFAHSAADRASRMHAGHPSRNGHGSGHPE